MLARRVVALVPRIVVRKREGDPFAEISFSHSDAQETESESKSGTDSKPVLEEKKRGPAPEHHAEHKEGAHENEKPRVKAEKVEEKKGEEIVGVNLLTQKPIIRGVKKKPVIRSVSEASPHPQKQSAENREHNVNAASEEDEMACDLTVRELRARQLRDITPVSNAPDARKPHEASRSDASDLARRIWLEREERKPLHRKLMRRLGFR